MSDVSLQVIKVAIVEDVRPLREGFSMLIGGTPGFRCTGAFRSMEEAIEKIGFDVEPPKMTFVSGARSLREGRRHEARSLLSSPCSMFSARQMGRLSGKVDRKDGP